MARAAVEETVVVVVVVVDKYGEAMIRFF